MKKFLLSAIFVAGSSVLVSIPNESEIIKPIPKKASVGQKITQNCIVRTPSPIRVPSPVKK